MENEATTKTPIPTRPGFHNFALCTLVFAFSTSLPSTFVETPLQISLFFAKQSQFQNGQYKHKYSNHKGLCQRTTNNEQRTLSKTNPIKPNFPAPLLRRERIQNLGAKRISRFIGPASKIGNPVSRIKHLPHFCRAFMASLRKTKPMSKWVI